MSLTCLEQAVNISIIGGTTVVAPLFIPTQEIKARYPELRFKIETRWDLRLRSVRAFRGASMIWSILLPLDPTKHKPRKKMSTGDRLFLQLMGQSGSVKLAKWPLHPALLNLLTKNRYRISSTPDADGDYMVTMNNSREFYIRPKA